MRAVGLHQFGGPDVLSIVDVPMPQPGVSEVRVRVEAASVCPADILFRSGALAHRLSGTSAPWVPGTEVAGVVDACGANTDLGVDERVMALVVPFDQRPGAYAEYVVVPQEAVGRLRPGVRPAEAASIPMSGLTAMMALDLAEADRCSSLVVAGAAGIVGSLTLQLARAFASRVIADSPAEDEARLYDLGADDVVDRGETFVSSVQDMTNGGVDSFIDAAGLGVAGLGALRDGGLYVPLRAPSQDVLAAAQSRNIDVRYAPVWKFASAQRLQFLADLFCQGKLLPPPVQLFAPEAAAAAHRQTESRGVRVRAVLDLTPATPACS